MANLTKREVISKIYSLELSGDEAKALRALLFLVVHRAEPGVKELGDIQEALSGEVYVKWDQEFKFDVTADRSRIILSRR